VQQGRRLAARNQCGGDDDVRLLASALYARNLLDFLKLTLTAEGFTVNLEDDIVAACLMCRDGQIVRKNG